MAKDDAVNAAPVEGQAPSAKAPRVSSEREFRRRLTRALRTGNIRELRALWHDPQLEPHMTLFVLLAASFAVGVLIWVVEPILMGA